MKILESYVEIVDKYTASKYPGKGVYKNTDETGVVEIFIVVGVGKEAYVYGVGNFVDAKKVFEDFLDLNKGVKVKPLKPKDTVSNQPVVEAPSSKQETLFSNIPVVSESFALKLVAIARGDKYKEVE